MTAGAVPPVGWRAPESDGPVTGKGTKGNWRLLAALGTVGQRAVGRYDGGLATGVVVVDLDDAVLHAHGVVGGALVESGEHAVATANDRSRIRRPAEADARLDAIGDVLDGLAVLRRDGRKVVVDEAGGRGELDVIADPAVKGEVRLDLPGVFGEAIEHLHPEVVLAFGGGRGVDLVDGLDEGVVVIAGVGIGVAWLAGECVLDPVLEVEQGGGVAVAVDAAALEEIDHDLVDEVDVAAELERVTALARGEDIGELDAVLVGFSDTRQSVGHAKGQDAGSDAGAGGVGAGRLEILTVLEVDLVDGGFGDLRGQAGDQEALVVAGGTVGRGRAIGEGVGRAVAVGRVVVGEVVVDEGVVAIIDVPVEPGEEEVLLLEAGRGALAELRRYLCLAETGCRKYIALR